VKLKDIKIIVLLTACMVLAVACQVIPLDEYNAEHRGGTTAKVITTDDKGRATTLVTLETTKPPLTDVGFDTETLPVDTEPPVPAAPNFLRDADKAFSAGAETQDIYAITASAGLVYGLDSKRLYYTKGADEDTLDPVAVTKLLTARTAIYNLEGTPDYIFEVKNEIDSVINDGLRASGISKGVKYGLFEALNGLLIGRYGDVAYTTAAGVARAKSGNADLSSSDAVNYFVDLMNQYALKIGCTGSTFINPNGHYQLGQYSNLHDMLLIAVDSAHDTTITGITSLPTSTISFDTGGEKTFNNSLPVISGYDTGGLSMGTNVNSCLTGLYFKGEEKYVVILVNSTSQEADIKKLLSYTV
jgi:D-alanyl-D-alanine carboxypeptidase